jgi:hypothetical protein
MILRRDSHAAIEDRNVLTIMKFDLHGKHSEFIDSVEAKSALAAKRKFVETILLRLLEEVMGA